MFNGLIKFFVFLTLVFTSALSYAANDFQVTEVTEDSINVSWNESEADFFQIYYDTESSSDGLYGSSTDILDGGEYTITDLSGDTSYYLMLEGFSDTGDSVFKSAELITKLSDTSTVSTDTSTFALEEINQTAIDEITLTFTKELSVDQSSDERQFKIEAVNDASEYYDVIDSEIDKEYANQLIVTLSGEPLKGKEYKVVVISLEDKNGNNIDYGVDSENTFLAGYEEDFSAAAPIENKQSERPVEEPRETQNQEVVSGEDIKEEDLNKDVHSVSNKKEDLPDTGPEHVILFFVALLLSAFFFVPKYVAGDK